MAATLKELIQKLQNTEIVPRPDNELWEAAMNRLCVPGRIAAIDAEAYFWFLECLSPKYQRGSLFAFAEGAEPLRLFWQRAEQYFCRQLTWDETSAFCRLVDIALPW